MHNFRRLVVWDRAHQLALAIRRATRRFPRTGYGEQKSQLVRAAESIASNIVEGCAAASRREFARYLDIAIKSTAETEYRLQLAFDNGVLDGRSYHAFTAEVVEIRKMLSGLRRSVLRSARRASARRAESAEPGDAGDAPVPDERDRVED